MKVYRTQLSLITTVYLPLFAIYLLLYLFMKQELLGFRTAHWLFLALACSVILSPQRKNSYHSDKKKLPGFVWFLSVSGFVSLLNSFFYLGHRFLGEVLTINKPIDLPPLHSLSGGLFPWALVALFAVISQVLFFRKGDPGLISECIKPVFNTTQHNEVGKYCNTYLRITIFFSLLIPLFFAGSVLLYFCTQYINIPLSYGINSQNLFATLVFFYLINFTQWQFLFNWLVKIGCPVLLGVILLLFSAMGALIILVATMHSLPLPYEIQYYPFDPSVWNIVLEILTIFIALSWVPLASSTIAILSRGYRVDQIIVATLLIPTISQLFTLPQSFLGNSHVAILLLCCSLLLLIIFLRESVIFPVSRGAFPKKFPIKKSKPILYLRSLTVTAIAFITIFWVTGIYLTTLLVSAFTITTTLLIMISIIHFRISDLKLRKIIFEENRSSPL